MTDPRFTDHALDHLRMVGDEPADALARALLTVYDANQHDETQIVGRAMRTIAAGTASDDDDVVAWLSDGPDLPKWADDELIAAGQRFFRAWPMPIATTLFCAALPTAYAAPNGAAVLLATSHLKERSQVARRLAATGQMLFDVMDFTGTANGALHPGGQGYLVVRGVRLLHAVVRQALLAREDEPWRAEHGTPINQEDLLGTLFSFTVRVLDGLAELGVPVTDDEARGYMHAWCVVGALLGIEESLLPLTPDEAGQVARIIARRQLAASPAGTELAGELLREMRMAMPAGCRGLPAALVHRLVPDVAGILDVPPGDPPWPAVVHSASTVGRRAPALIKLAGGPAALVGRSMLRMLVDREQQPDGPSYRVDTVALRRAIGGREWRRVGARTDRRRRQGDVVGVGPHVEPPARMALAALAHPIALPIDADDVRLVASEGFPLWEPVDVVVCRNQRITIAYADLSRRLARIVAGRDRALDANWCTFATWASRTLGTFLDDIPGYGDGDADVETVEDEPLARQMERLARRLMTRSNGASLRTLAAANRAVFLEIGLAIATFADHFPERASAMGRDGQRLWELYWAAVEEQLDELAVLDPSWLLTPHPRPDDLRLGLRQYFEALRTDDQERRSQHVLAGNLLLGAYEQRRADGYIWAALALFTGRAMRRLVCDRNGAVGGVRRWPNGLYARVMTRRMHLQLADELLLIRHPIPPPPNRQDRWHTLATDVGVTLPILQALVTRYQLAAGRQSNPGARNWTSFDQRMRTIGNLFRLRQRQAGLFDDPFPPEETAQLLAGGAVAPEA